MLQKQKTLALLHEELRILVLLDRVHDYTPNPDAVADRAHANRQIRRSQIMAEIRKLSPSKPEYRNPAWIGTAVLLICTVGYAALHYLFR